MKAKTAGLEIRVDSYGVHAAEAGLERLEKTGERAEKATDGVTEGFKRIDRSSDGVEKATEKVRQGLDDVEKSSKRTKRATDELNEEFKRIDRSSDEVKKATKKVTKGLDDVEKSSNRTKRATDEVNEEFNEVERTAKRAKKATTDFSKGLKSVESSGKKARKATDAVNDEFKEVESSGKRAARATDGVTAALTRVLGPAALLYATGRGLKKIFDVTREYEIFAATLETVTGSSVSANIAFQALEGFAERTPFVLEQSVEAFIKLTNLGLTPSERALVSYGDTASSMGKDLNQLIEAVADAATNEFERLKEFGIKASQQADTVSFTFRGVTTTVKKNAEEIQEYLIKLGETNFAGNMIKRMKGVDGAASNFEDTWNSVFRTISEKGVGDVITSSIRGATDALQFFEDALDSGQVEQSITAIGTTFISIKPFIDEATFYIENAFIYWSKIIDSVTDSMSKNIDLNISHIPENIRGAMQLAAVEFAVLVDYGSIYGEAFGKAFGAKLANLVDKTAIYAKELIDILNVFDGDSFDHVAALKAGEEILVDMSDSYFEEAQRQIEVTRKARISSLISIVDEHDKKIEVIDKEINKIAELGRAYREHKKNSAVTIDDIPKVSTKVEEGKTNPDLQSQRDFNQLIDNVIPPAERINAVFEKRLALIEENTIEGSAKQADLIERLNRDYATQVLEGFNVEVEENDFDARAAVINADYDKRRKLILANAEITEKQQTDLILRLTKVRGQKLNKVEVQRVNAQRSILVGGLDNLSSLMNSKSRKLFEIGKVAAISSAVVSGIEAAVHSYKFGAQIGGPFVGAAFAATSAIATGVQIQAIDAQQFGGGASSIPSVSGGSSASSFTPSPQPRQSTSNQSFDKPAVTEFHFHGDWRVNNMREFLQEMDEYIEESDHISASTVYRNQRAA